MSEYRIVAQPPNEPEPVATGWLSLDELLYAVRFNMLRYGNTIKIYTIEVREDDNANR